MKKMLKATEIERLENTSFATALAANSVIHAEGVIGTQGCADVSENGSCGCCNDSCTCCSCGCVVAATCPTWICNPIGDHDQDDILGLLPRY